jgi:hypothetical protein
VAGKTILPVRDADFKLRTCMHVKGLGSVAQPVSAIVEAICSLCREPLALGNQVGSAEEQEATPRLRTV